MIMIHFRNFDNSSFIVIDCVSECSIGPSICQQMRDPAGAFRVGAIVVPGGRPEANHAVTVVNAWVTLPPIA